uniref:TspO/MBR family protein n=1 Tax=viral metagenome TaxID=1070528 RepID=A0A6C0J3F1_9ZZZZ
MSNHWYNSLNKSEYKIDEWVFRYIWPVIFMMIAKSFFIVYNSQKCPGMCNITKIFIIHFILNILWGTIFFDMKNIQLAMFNMLLVFSSLIMIMKKIKTINYDAYKLLIPYFIWICIALYFNLFIYFNN